MISDMDQPLGRKVGNALEVIEAIDTLRGKGPEDFTLLVKTLATYMIMLGGKASSEDEALKMIDDVIESGRALDKLAEFVKAQGGDPAQVYDTSLLKIADKKKVITAEKSGYISRIVCDSVGVSCMMLGGGRASKEDVIDLSVGIELLKKVGSKVTAGDELAYVYYNDEKNLESALDKLIGSYEYSDNAPEAQKLIKEVIR